MSRYFRLALIVAFVVLILVIAVLSYISFVKTPTQKTNTPTIVKTVGKLPPAPNKNAADTTPKIEAEIHKGTIVSIATTDTYLKEENAYFRLFTLKNDKGTEFTAYINPKDIKPNAITEVVNGKEQPIQFSQLKPGDNIQIILTKDNSKPNSSTEARIIVLR